MSASLFGTTGLSFGLTTETGILAQSYGRTVSGEERLIKNHEGDTAGGSYYDAQAEHTISGYVTGALGIPAASYGTALTIASAIEANGVAAGLLICTGITDTLENEDFQMIEVTAKQYPLLTAAL